MDTDSARGANLVVRPEVPLLILAWRIGIIIEGFGMRDKVSEQNESGKLGATCMVDVLQSKE